MTPDEALRSLMTGNANFAAGNSEKAPFGLCESKKKELLEGQNPFAVVVCCSDSRINPQYLFDCELGDIFVIRVAGCVLDDVSIGSIEYALEFFSTPLIMILGHQSCGAVKAAVDGATGSRYLNAIVDRIAPSVEKVRKRGGPENSLWNDSVVENALSTARGLLKRSEVVRERVKKKELKVVAAFFNLMSARVELVSETLSIEGPAPKLVCYQKKDEIK